MQAVHGCCLSVLEAYGRISSSTCCVSRCSHLEIWTFLLCPRIFQFFWCLGVACGVRRIRDACAAWFNSGYMLYVRLWTNFSIFYVAVNLKREAVLLQVCTVVASGGSFSQRGLHIETWTLFLRVLHFLAAQCSWSPR